MIDTQAKRMSAVSARRLPWMRRFQPVPDGTIDQGDRQAVAFVYSGIEAGELNFVSGPYRTLAAQYHVPGAEASQYHVPGSEAAQAIA